MGICFQVDTAYDLAYGNESLWGISQRIMCLVESPHADGFRMTTVLASDRRVI